MPDLEVSPMTLTAETGEYVPKIRLTHDLPLLGAVSKEYVNYRVDKEILDPIIFKFVCFK